MDTIQFGEYGFSRNQSGRGIRLCFVSCRKFRNLDLGQEDSQSYNSAGTFGGQGWSFDDCGRGMYIYCFHGNGSGYKIQIR